MNPSDARQILRTVFERLRRRGFNLGVGELLAAYQAVDGGIGFNSNADLDELARLLWCHSVEEAAELQEIVRAVFAEIRPEEPNDGNQPKPRTSPTSDVQGPTHPKRPDHADPTTLPPAPLTSPPPLADVKPAPLPVRTPVGEFRPEHTGPELRPYWPLSRRAMVYAWRQFRRLVSDGPRDQPDIAATIEQSIRQGYFLAPVMARRSRNQAGLILLVDQGGSMVPFHRFTRDLVETASSEQDSRLRKVRVVYFQNALGNHGFNDPHLTQPIAIADVLTDLDADTGVLVVSDAGAARGQRRPERIRASAEFLSGIKRLSDRVAWLNPMPEPRWSGSSAQFIARLAPMFQMDADGFGRAIGVLRGQHSRRPS